MQKLKKALVFGLMLSFIMALYFVSLVTSAASPNEAKIFLHLHQATRWAELSYSGKCLFSRQGIENHLIEVKYTEPRLVDSKFHRDYIFLRDLIFTKNETSYTQIEEFREKIHAKAEKLNIRHPKNWRNEFYVCSYGINKGRVTE